VLVIGLGGGTAVKQFLAAYPEVIVDAVEIDDEVAKIARRWFYLPPDSNRFHLFVEDGRRYLESHQTNYDLIIIDAYHNDAIPFHMVTRQFFELAHAHLNSGGLIALNLISALDGPNSGIAASVYQTTAAAGFPEHYTFPVQFRQMRSRVVQRNICFIVGDGFPMTEQDLRTAASRSPVPRYARNVVDLDTHPPDLRYAKFLSDDYAPVDDLLMPK
jgi:spermidine synthase